eukprot:TRINITY_DN5467_c0_g1_i1.p1 TRINITY_DN5467_c0_g1~~TRINITY_DN5467_c0_g1_i1.p1  ORF type:complete len:176 (+),score=10.49 TRINITY_DN5467_c0_g1_i1:1116-1643(+)
MQRQQRNPVNNLRRPVSTVKLCQSEALQVEDEDAREAEDGALAGARGEGTMLACALKDLVQAFRPLSAMVLPSSTNCTSTDVSRLHNTFRVPHLQLNSPRQFTRCRRLRMLAFLVSLLGESDVVIRCSPPHVRSLHFWGDFIFCKSFSYSASVHSMELFGSSCLPIVQFIIHASC